MMSSRSPLPADRSRRVETSTASSTADPLEGKIRCLDDESIVRLLLEAARATPTARNVVETAFNALFNLADVDKTYRGFLAAHLPSLLPLAVVEAAEEEEGMPTGMTVGEASAHAVFAEVRNKLFRRELAGAHLAALLAIGLLLQDAFDPVVVFGREVGEGEGGGGGGGGAAGAAAAASRKERKTTAAKIAAAGEELEEAVGSSAVAAAGEATQRRGAAGDFIPITSAAPLVTWVSSFLDLAFDCMHELREKEAAAEVEEEEEEGKEKPAGSPTGAEAAGKKGKGRTIALEEEGEEEEEEGEQGASDADLQRVLKEWKILAELARKVGTVPASMKEDLASPGRRTSKEKLVIAEGQREEEKEEEEKPLSTSAAFFAREGEEEEEETRWDEVITGNVLSLARMLEQIVEERAARKEKRAAGGKRKGGAMGASAAERAEKEGGQAEEAEGSRKRVKTEEV